MDEWRSTVQYAPRVASAVRDVTPTGNEPQLFVDGSGTAHFVYRVLIPKRAPDGSIVDSPQLAYANILPNGQFGRGETIATDREPNLRVFGQYFAPALRELVLVGPPDGQGDFYAIWPHYTSGFSLVQFSEYGFPKSREFRIDGISLENIDELSAVMDFDRNIHAVWTECPYCFADPEIRGSTRVIRHIRVNPRSRTLLTQPLLLGERPSASGNAETFHPEVCLDGERDVLVLIDQGENARAFAVKVDGTNGTVTAARTLDQNFVEPDCVVLPDGQVALAAMLFKVGTGRNIYFAMLNPDLTTRLAPVALSNTIQQSDGARITPIGSDFYVAFNENQDNLMRLGIVRSNGGYRRGPVKLSGPGVGFPFRLRLARDNEGSAHIVYADGKGSIPARITYEKRTLD